MNGTAACSRRTFLKVASSTLLIASSGCSLGKPSWEEISERMIGLLHYPERARLIGSLYIDATPEVHGLTFEQWAGELLRLLGLESDQITGEILNSLDQRIRRQIRQDFVDENVVIVKGFMFSKTEIMLCSLAASYAAQE